MGLKRSIRLRKSRQFQAVRQQGRSLAHPLFILNWLPNDLSATRYGFVIGKRIGNAVRRNSVKRRMREVVRHMHLETESGWDIVLIARTAIATATFIQIKEAIEHLCNRAHLWPKAPQQETAKTQAVIEQRAVLAPSVTPVPIPEQSS